MRISESRIRRIIKEEAHRVLREGPEGSAGDEGSSGHWVVSNGGYELSDAPRNVAEAWYNFTVAVADLEEFMNDGFPDPEAGGEPLKIGDAAVHQAQTFLTER